MSFKLPLFVSEESGVNGANFYLKFADEENIFLDGLYAGQMWTRGDAEAAARAINNHTALLAACETSLAMYEEFARSHMLSDAAVADMERLRQVIAKSKE